MKRAYTYSKGLIANADSTAVSQNTDSMALSYPVDSIGTLILKDLAKPLIPLTLSQVVDSIGSTGWKAAATVYCFLTKLAEVFKFSSRAGQPEIRNSNSKIRLQ